MASQASAALWIGSVLAGGLALYGLVRWISPSPISAPIPNTPPFPAMQSGSLTPVAAIGPYGLATPGAST